MNSQQSIVWYLVIELYKEEEEDEDTYVKNDVKQGNMYSYSTKKIK